MMTHNVLWGASLSNGQTVYEGKGAFQEKADEPSPWQRLLLYLSESKAEITSLFLYTENGQRWNLPSTGNKPKFKAFYEAENPIDYKMFRSIARNINKETGQVIVTDHFTCIEALYSRHVLQIWVSEDNPRNSWVLTKPL